jgi:hypothetical protein
MRDIDLTSFLCAQCCSRNACWSAVCSCGNRPSELHIRLTYSAAPGTLTSARKSMPALLMYLGPREVVTSTRCELGGRITSSHKSIISSLLLKMSAYKIQPCYHLSRKQACPGELGIGTHRRVIVRIFLQASLCSACRAHSVLNRWCVTTRPDFFFWLCHAALPLVEYTFSLGMPT